MANRHSNKKLRAEVRARMAATGESHQTALSRVIALRSKPGRAGGTAIPDLIATSYFGVSITVAAYAMLSHVRLILVSGTGGPIGLPWGRPLPICVHTDGVQ